MEKKLEEMKILTIYMLYKATILITFVAKLKITFTLSEYHIYVSETQETNIQNMFVAILMLVNLGIGKFLKLYKDIKSKWLIREIIFNGV